MLPFIIALIVFLLFAIIIITMIWNDIPYIIINLVILWFILLRSYFEIRYKKIFYPYLISFVLTAIINILWFDYIQIPMVFWPVWFITLLFIIGKILVWIWNLIKYLKRNKRTSKKK
jgi:hypothetical protein